MGDRVLDRRLALGVVVVLVVGLAVAAAIVRPRPFDDAQRIVVVFDDATGISLVQRDVRVAGVRVGRIGNVRRVGDDAEVELLIDEPIGTIHRDARVALRPHTVFEGTAYADLDPGSASAPPLGTRIIPKAQTTVYVSVDRAFSGFKRPVRDDLRDALGEASRALDEPVPNAAGDIVERAPGLLRDTATGARALRGVRGNELRSALAGLDQTIGAVTDGAPLDETISSVDRTTAALTVDDAAPLDATLRRSVQTLDGLRRAGAGTDRLLGSIAQMSRTVEPQLNELDTTLALVRPLLVRARRDLATAPQLMDRTGDVLDSVVGSADAIDTASGTLGRTAGVLVRSFVPALNARSFLGLPMYAQLMAAASGFTGAMGTFQTKEQNPSGYGHSLRGTLDLGDPTLGPPKPPPLPEGR